MTKKLTLSAKIFLILALAAFIICNAFAVMIYISACETASSYSPEMIQDPIASMALFGIGLSATVGSIVAAGVGNLLSIIFTSFSISFSSKALRACSHTPPYSAPYFIKTFSIILLIISTISLLLTVPTYTFLAFLIGI